MNSDELQEPLKKRVGGSLSRLPALSRLAMLQRNALLLRGNVWKPPHDHGTLVRKTVGRTSLTTTCASSSSAVLPPPCTAMSA